MSGVKEASVYVTAVRIEYAGAQLAGDHASGVSELLVDDAYEFNEGGGEFLIASDTLTYTGWDDESNTIVLSAPTSSAYDADEKITLLPSTPIKVADVVDISGASIPAVVWHTLDPFLREGIYGPDEQPTGTIFYTGDYDKVWLVNVPGKVASIDPDAVEVRTITNLCTDPKPVDLLSWTDDATPTGGSTAMDGTYPGTAFRVDRNPTFGYGFPFSLPSIGPLADLVPDPIDGTPLLPLTRGNLTLAFNVRADFDYVVYARLDLFDDLGVNLGVPVVTTYDYITGGTDSTWSTLGDWGQPKSGGATVRSVWGVDVDGVTTDYPDAAYVGLRFSIGQPILIGELSGSVWLGNGSIYAASTSAYGDGDTDGWVDNGDGTSTGPEPFSLSWDEINHPDLFPPSAHTHPSTDITDFDPAVQAIVDAAIAALPPVDVPTTQYLPVTTTVGGVPELVWDSNDELVLTEVPLP